jgi:hypothetical protein
LGVAWEKFSRTTSNPARIIRRKMLSERLAGPIVAMIFVLIITKKNLEGLIFAAFCGSVKTTP